MTKPTQSIGMLGDLPEKEFRAALSQATEWASDYRANLGEPAISVHGKPGDVSAQLPPSIPRLPVPIKTVMGVYRVCRHLKSRKLTSPS